MDISEKALDRIRQLCLRMPETGESGSWGHPNFRAGKRTFVAFEWVEGRPSIAIFLGSDEADAFLLRHDEAFVTPYGRGKWISLWADGELDWELLEDLVERAYRKVALKRMIAALDERAAS